MELIKQIKQVGWFGFLISLLFFAACSSTPEIQEFPRDANPTEEIESLQGNLENARQDQVNVLSPDKFEKAEKQLEEAKEARDDNKDNEDILKEVALGNAWLLQAIGVARTGADTIPEIVDVRKRTLEAEAPEYSGELLKEADEKLIDIAKDFEDGNFKVDGEDRQELLDQYMAVELEAIKAKELGPAREQIEQAKNEGAEDIAPQTLALAEKRLKDADALITASRDDKIRIGEVGTKAREAAERALRITRDSNANKNKTPEQLALELEQEGLAQRELQSALMTTQEELGARDQELSVIAAENSEMTDQIALDEKLQEARTQFNEQEADVYRQDDILIIRLKGLRFPSGQADLPADNYSLLSKLQSVIESIGAAEIEIQGHTDSTGSPEINSRLSEARADAVRNYLVENVVVDEWNIIANGYGDQEPIASNRTRDGRAQNRRVDVIIRPILQ